MLIETRSRPVGRPLVAAIWLSTGVLSAGALLAMQTVLIVS